MISYGDRSNDYDSILKYFKNKFDAIRKQYSKDPDREFYVFPTSVTDTHQTGSIITSGASLTHPSFCISLTGTCPGTAVTLGSVVVSRSRDHAEFSKTLTPFPPCLARHDLKGQSSNLEPHMNFLFHSELCFQAHPHIPISFSFSKTFVSWFSVGLPHSHTRVPRSVAFSCPPPPPFDLMASCTTCINYLTQPVTPWHSKLLSQA